MPMPTRVTAPLGALIGAAIFLACSPVEAPVPPIPATPELALQGQVIVNGLGACGHCHSLAGEPGAPLSGGRKLRDEFGDIDAPNITLAKTGLGSWSEGDLIRVFRAYVKPDGSEVAPSFHSGVEWMSDVDLGAVMTYVRTLPPVESEIQPRSITWLDRNTVGFFDSKSEVRGFVPQIPRAFRVEYGQYLVDHVAHCGSCHSVPEGIISSSRYMAGGEDVWFDGEVKVAPNITASPESRLAGWSESDYRTFFASGRTPDGRQIDERFCPLKFYRRAPADELEAMIAYLRTIPAP